MSALEAIDIPVHIKSPDRYPIPNIQDLTANLAGERIFGMNYNSSSQDIKNFLKPLEVKAVYLLKYKRNE